MVRTMLCVDIECMYPYRAVVDSDYPHSYPQLSTLHSQLSIILHLLSSPTRERTVTPIPVIVIAICSHVAIDT